MRVRFLLPALALLTSCSACDVPVLDPVAVEPSPPWVGHYASDTEVLCTALDDREICVTYSGSVDLFEDGSCEFRQAIAAYPAGEGWSLSESQSCTYHYVASHYKPVEVLTAPAFSLFGTARVRSDGEPDGRVSTFAVTFTSPTLFFTELQAELFDTTVNLRRY